MMVASVNRTRKETHKKALVVLLRHDGSHGIHGEAVIMIRGEAEVLKLDLTTESILVGKNRSCASTTSRSFIKRDALHASVALAVSGSRSDRYRIKEKSFKIEPGGR